MLQKIRAARISVATSVLVVTLSSSTLASDGTQGITYQGITYQGAGFQGITYQGITYQGITYQGNLKQGITYQGITYQGITYQGITYQGITYQGITYQGITYQGITYQGITYQGSAERGTDRLAKLGPVVDFQNLELPSRTAPIGTTDPHLVLVPRADSSVQGLQPNGSSPTFRELQVDPSAVQLQAGPTDSTYGDYIFVPGLVDSAGDPTGTKALTGTFWSGVFTNGADKGALPLYISSVEIDSGQNSSKYPSNSDVYLYSIYFLDPVTQQWVAACPSDDSGRPRAMAIPVNPFDRSSASRSKFTFACTASGVASKCARNWGYKPWKTVNEKLWNGSGFVSTDVSLAPFYDACLIAARADYCQDDHSYTKNGTLVDLFDTVDGLTSINATAGLPYAPFASGPMLHEEYQISTGHFVSENFTSNELANMSVDDRDLVSRLRRSGMESSRYADLDPGRTCAASPYIDRCDPREPYACYRAANLNASAYGAFLALNSPRHCSHDEEHDGEALDPLCNECVNRVCQIDPSCCGDPGSGFYPGSLVWDARCTEIRQSVCRSDASAPLWPAGSTAPPAGSHPVTFLRGAIGAFEGFVTEAGTTYAQGWACDPDHPDISIPVQVSVGGALGATGATLSTATASEVLAPAWKETVAAECGGGARHGFRVAMPTATTATDVYVYGIDADLPGAPFSLLRGGKKTLAATAATPHAAIWTGWIEPTASGNYAFCKQLPGSAPAACEPSALADKNTNPDLYRLWVNGSYVAGNWKDEDASVPGAFTLDPPTGLPTQYLLAGVRYAVRVEYQRPDTLPASSQFALLWQSPDGTVPALAAPALVPANALYPMAQSAGGGLRGTYYAGIATLGNPAVQAPTQTVGGVNYLWTGKNQPIVGPGAAPVAGFTVGDSFSAVFEGQVVPPISGDYTFTADTDGGVRIFVDGQLATQAAGEAPVPDPDTCSHDICRAGAAVSRTCRQGGFCSAQICITDPYCCSVTWDANCLRKVADVCHLDCSPTPPAPITLRAGEKAQIRVEYQHIGTLAGGPTVHGGRLTLQWALPGALRETIPAERQFADGAVPAKGVGLNAAYFSDATFQTEYLDHVEGPLAFDASVLPGPTRAASLLCADASCGASGPPAPPALVAATNRSASGANISVDITGRGAVDGASIEICDGSTATGTFVPASSGPCFAVSTPGGVPGGTFIASVVLARGAHTLAVHQSVGGQMSVWSAALAIDAEDPAAPPAPTIVAPAGGYLSGTGTINVSGTATPNATVTVKVGTTTIGTFTADGAGRWSGSVTLPGPGGYALTITETVNGVESPTGASASARVALPPLLVTSPPDGASVTGIASPGACGAATGAFTVQGSGAVPSQGNIRIGDGDGRFFADEAQLPVNPNGVFTGPVGALDCGRHELKIFQRTASGDDAGVVRAVLVKPPVVTAITAPAPAAIVDAAVTIVGQGLPRIGLPGTAVVYQDGQELGEATIAADGSFQVPVQIGGSGLQTLTVTQRASSLSGAGAAESGPVPLTVVVKPPAPTIVAPTTGSTHLEFDVTVSVTAIPGASVTIIVDGLPNAPVIVDPSGNYTGMIHFAAGSHHLRATQTLAGATGPATAEVLIAVGDVTPPTVSITDENGAPLRELPITTSDPTGAAVDFSARVSAQDCTAGIGCVSLTPACLPPSGSRFQLGSTSVTCSATDAAGNRGSSAFLVTVRPPATSGPTVGAANVVAEATGPDGAAVAYQVAATGYVADCAPPGSDEPVACTTWQPAYGGLGFTPNVVAIDTHDPTVAPDGKRHGALYVKFYDLPGGAIKLLKSTDGGATWQKLPSPWLAGDSSQIVVGPGSPASLYIPGAAFGGGGTQPLPPDEGPGNEPLDGGLKVSHDGGASWTTVLDHHYIEWVFQDPTDPSHMLAANQAIYAGAQPVYLFETHDAWATSTNASTEGLPTEPILAAAIDPIHPDRMYASVLPATSDVVKVQIYRKVGATPWQRLDIPPYPDVLTEGAKTVAIAPTLEPGQTFPTVFAGPIYSRDGGKTWKPHFLGSLTAVVFDRQNPGALWAAGTGNMFQSPGYDPGSDSYPFFGLSFFAQPVSASIVQDAADPATLYSAFPGLGMFRTTNGGALWTPLLAPGISLPAVQVRDIAFDPVDPHVAYLTSFEGGVFRSDDGGGSWQGRNVGLDDPFTPVNANKLAVDRFNRNNVYLGGIGGVWKSPDGPGTPADRDAHWTQLSDAQFLALDPRVPDTALAVTDPNMDSGLDPSCVFVGGESRCYFPFHYQILNNGGSASDDLLLDSLYSGHYDTNGGKLTSFNLAFVPDRRRTLLMSFVTDTTLIPSSVLFASTKTDNGPSLILGHDTDLETRKVFFDASDGTNRLFVGSGALAAAQGGLYRTTVDAALAARRQHPEDAGWQLVTPPKTATFPDGSAAPFARFERLLVDPASGGQVMYTIGVGNTAAQNLDTLWESRDGGHTWRSDSSVNLTNVWVSPTDGALYATRLDPAFNWVGWYWQSPIDHLVRVDVQSEPQFPYQNGTDPQTFPGLVWKRTLSQGTPPGARVVLGDLRPTCTGAGGVRAVGPGSTFPLGATTLSCAATDAFGHTTTQAITITVGDTTPPVLTVPGQATGSAPAGGTVTIGFTVTATDAVDGAITPTCDHLSGSSFPIGITTVTCIATDSHHNTGHASFPVIVAQDGDAPPALPTLTTPGDVTAEATASNGATVVLAVSAATTDSPPVPLTPACTAPLGPAGAIVTIDPAGTLFPIGATDVTCAATSAGATNARTFRVMVKDTTPPALTVPADFALDAEGAWGRQNVAFTTTASDAVDGPLTPTCTPESPATFPIGSTLVTCRAADHAGNRATATFHVAINGLPPALVLADTTADATDRLGARVTFDPAPRATDTANHTLTVDCVPPDKTWFPMGDTPVSCSTTDGTRESRGSFTVHVVDRRPPDVTVPASITVEAAGPAGATVAFSASASDAVDGVCTSAGPCRLVCQRVTGLSPPTAVVSPALFPIGDSAVTCTASDAVGNAASASFVVTVRDTTAPALTLPAPITVTADATGTAQVTFTATASDVVGGSIPVGCTPRSGSLFLVGTNTVVCTARDAAGNETTGTFPVVVYAATRGLPCASDASCGPGVLCIDGVCCENSCGGGNTSDCQACSVAAGGTTDGVCTPVVAGHVCRTKVDLCDVADTCDGSSLACPDDALAAPGTVCRPAVPGGCDVQETCSGSSAACPPDTLAAPGTVCRPAVPGGCDVQETCSGSSAACPPDGFVPNGTPCRGIAGVCDVAEACSGLSATCPTDGVIPGGTTCPDDGRLCTADQCDGAGVACTHPTLPTSICSTTASGPACGSAPSCVSLLGGDATAGGLTLNFQSPWSGEVKVSESGTGCPPPTGFEVLGSTQLPSNAHYWNVDANPPVTPASGIQIEICFGYQDSWVTGSESNIRIIHGNGSSCADGWTMLANSRPIDTTRNEICAYTNSLSPFALVEPINTTDHTPPVFTNVPAPITAYATSTAGAIVNYTNPTATDDVDGVRPVDCKPASGSTFAPVTKTVTCTASDTSGNTASVDFTVTVKYQAPTDGTFFLQPINPDGSSIFKLGNTIPVKFVLQGVSAGITNLSARLLVTKASNSVTGSFVETNSTGSADSGNTFRYDPTAKQYIFNLSTKGLTTGTWSLRADLGDGVTHTVNVSLR